MCGILFRAFTGRHAGLAEPDADLKDLLGRRGPDVSKSLEFELGVYKVLMYSTVLHMRGPTTVQQPVISSSGRYAFQWNGEAYCGPFPTTDTECDTSLVLDAIDACGHPMQALGKVEGEFAFVLLDITAMVVWFGRDLFGRRSLLMRRTDKDLELMSVSGVACEQVSSSLVYCFDMTSGALTATPWSVYGRLIPRISSFVTDNELTVDGVSEFKQQLGAAVARRLVDANSVGILFSGGVDSLAIAALCCSFHNFKTHICLYNVAFSATGEYHSVPDRKTGVRAYQELRTLYPDRGIELIEINVPKTEFDELVSAGRLDRLMFPNKSVMDTSIAAALWFAAQSTKNRVLLLGMGADEQLGGYSRHASAFGSGGYERLREELQLDLDRIGSRNLGRDDRVICDWSREARFPFLDEQFVEYLATVPVNSKYVPQAPKHILREMLKSMGFSASVYLAKKRAIQFGAQTARMQKLAVSDD